jgi:hypothetical protein
MTTFHSLQKSTDNSKRLKVIALVRLNGLQIQNVFALHLEILLLMAKKLNALVASIKSSKLKIERNDIMAEKKYTVEELRQMCEDTEANLYELREQLKKQEQEEKDRRKAQLLLEKEDREKELREVHKHYTELLNAYLRDYNSFGYGRMWIAQ